VLESLFQFLFKYPFLMYQEGALSLGAPGRVPLALGLGAALAVTSLWAYRRSRGRAKPRTRLALAGLRTGAFALLLFLLLRPGLTVSRTVPQENFLAVLMDDSRSMAIQDRDGPTRGARAWERFSPEESDLMEDLSGRFLVRRYAFSSDLRRLGPQDSLSLAGGETRIMESVNQVAAELSSLPLSGIVVVTDGGESGSGDLAAQLLPLQRAGVPVFTVGMGSEVMDRDLQLGRLEVPGTALVGSTLTVDVLVTQQGFDGRPATIRVLDEGRIVTEEPLDLPSDGAPATTRVRIPMDRAGARTLRFEVVPLSGERLVENNSRDALVRVEDRRDRILYLEGEPRWETRFLRQGVREDENLQVVLFHRSADSRFLRLGVEDPDELLGGFPRSREELFAYRGLILGSVEAGFFTPDQLSMISDFVSQRGGGLLVLGGRRALGAGGYDDTPVADVLPLTLRRGAVGAGLPMAVEPTRTGAGHPITQIRDTEEESAEAWEALPGLLDFHPPMDPKPGATVLLTGTPEGGGDERPLLAVQRFGRGRVAVLTVEDLWTWQFHHDIPVEDPTHERLLRQLLRWLVEDAPRQVAAQLPAGRMDPRRTMSIRATVDDSTYLERNDGVVTARVTSPSGEVSELALDWTVEEDGVYGAPFTPRDEGIHRVEVEARADGILVGTDVGYFLAAPSTDEAFDPGMRRPLLERIARETGGRFYTEGTLDRLPQELSVRGGGVTTVERLDIWDAPFFLFILLGLLSAEWVTRKRSGLI
jgi:uncharacterized membrane protein